MKRYVLLFIMLIPALWPGSVSAQENKVQIDSIKNILRTAKNDSTKVDLLNGLNSLFSEVSIDSQIYYSRAAQKLSEEIHYTRGKGDALKNIAQYYHGRGQYSEAMQTALDAMKEYERIGATAKIAGADLELAMIAKDIGGQRRTQEYVDMGLAYAKAAYDNFSSIFDTSGVVSSLITRSVLYRDKALVTKNYSYYDSSFFHLSTGLRLIERTGKGQQYLAKLYNGLSQIYTEHKDDYRTALTYLFKAVELNQANNKQLSLSYNYGNISEAYRKLNDHVNSLKYARAMLAISQEMDRPERIQNALYQLFQVYRSAKVYDSAHWYYVRADAVNDSLTDVRKTMQVIEMQSKYENDKKEAAIKLLNIQKAQDNKRIVLLVVALLVFVVLAIGLVLLYGRIRRQKEKITQQSLSVELLMKELHHRVKNNLQVVSSLLSLQTYKLQDETSIAVLKESQMRVQAMSLVHQRLYKTDEFTNVNMKEYVTDLAEMLMSSYGYDKNGLDLQLDIRKEWIHVDKALPMGLIINELVTNSMKYAYKNVAHPVLSIGLVEEHGNYILTVKDNGPGLDEALWKKDTGSFGKQLISALSKQLRAQHSLSLINGTAFTITIPNKEKTT